MRSASETWHRAGETIGLVPTMGALHAGHIALVEAAKRENARTVVSIFVNPLQFGQGEDFERYPRPLDADLSLLEPLCVDAVYTPSVEDMYPPESLTRVKVDRLGKELEGESRPGHFEGVATVVTKLFAACRPDNAYFGQKDAQQAVVVTRLSTDLDLGVRVRVCPTVREPDGLAISSRNAYLGPAEREAALCLINGLGAANAVFQAGNWDAEHLRRALRQPIEAEPLARLDYAELVDPVTFQLVGGVLNAEPRAVVAAWIGSTRLIDNHLLGDPV